MRDRCYILLVILFCSFKVWGQEQGNVTVHNDPRLDVLLKKKKSIAMASTKPAKPATYANTPVGKPAHTDTAHVASTVPTSASKPGTPVAETTAVEAPKPVRPPIYIREKEGRVLYSGKGFRVQIYSGNDREKAISIKTEVMRRYPATRTYLSYISPAFRVKVGDYRSRAEAAAMQRELRENYTPCVIVPDNITINSK